MITFIIPTIGRDTLKRSIKSIEDQTSDQWKVIVIFDGVKSTINNSNSKIVGVTNKKNILFENK